jgi:4-amino-4-deoxy-L-arabinose transferase-like glycosyltransferase
LRAGLLVIVVVMVARWLYLASDIIELSQDEAYQWQWSKHLALAYYSKPPLIAYTQFVGTALWGDNVFGVRFFAPLIAAALGIMVLRFFAREVGARVGFFLLLCMLATPLLSVGATLMTVDPLSVLFWTAAMFAGWMAIRPEAGAREWAWVGLWMGLGLLSKFTQLFQLLCWAVFFALWRPARVHLRRPGPWLALAINLLAFTPVFIWNQQHGWITAEHVLGDNAGLKQSWPPPLADMAEWFFTFLGQELGLLNPVFFVSLVWAAVAFWKRYRDDVRQVYFFAMGAPVFLVYLAWTLHSRVLPNWIAPAILPLFCLMAIYWERERLRGLRRVVPSLAAGLIVGFGVVLVLHDTNLLRKITGRNLPDHLDPIARVSGWRASAEVVGEARRRLLREGKPVFIIGAHYGITSLISFYLPEAKAGVPHDPLVYYQTSARPVNQYYFWPGYRDRKGQNAIFVVEVTPGRSPAPPPVVEGEFESVTPLPLQPVVYRGRTLHQLQLYECRNLR